MILCDTGPLVALIDRDDPEHGRCASVLPQLPSEPLLTTWPCMTEAIYLLGRVGGQPAQNELWCFLADELLHLYLPAEDEWQRIRDLMQQYSDIPMDMADASLVSVAERVSTNRIFTIDSHFQAYRINNRQPFDILPVA